MPAKWFDSPFILALVPCCVFRFVIFAPFAFYWAHASTHRRVIRDHVELHNGLYDPTIATGEQIAASWGTFAFYWNFAVWLPSFWFPPPLNLPIAVIDTVITIYLAKATHYQTSYVPHSTPSCKGAAFTWHRPAGADEGFFEAAARLNGTVTSPVKMCQTFVQEWQHGITITTFYALISLINIVAFFGSIIAARRKGESLTAGALAVIKGLTCSLLSIPKLIIIILWSFLWFLPEYFFLCLPIPFKNHVRFGRRYALKTGVSLEQKAEVEGVEMKRMYQRKRRTVGRYKGGHGTPTPLSDFLSIYDMLMVVIEQMHYSDVMSLSCVSKSVRNAVLPPRYFEQRIAAFRRYTCPLEGRAGCWLCDKQICIGCQQLPIVTQDPLSHHSSNCRPYCQACYFTDIASYRPPQAQRTNNPYCRCAPPSLTPNVFMRWYRGPGYYKRAQQSQVKYARAVCRDCNLYPAAELLELRKKKTKIQLLEGRRSNGTKWKRCGKPGCNNELETGPRWWVCGLNGCRKECRSFQHQSWGMKAQGTVIGEHAV